MQSSEQKLFFKMVRGLFEMADKNPSQNVYETWWRILNGFTMAEFSHALDIYAATMTRSFMPVPGGLIEHIPSARQISADEAWAHVPKDESTGAWLTHRMGTALTLANGLIDEGDMIAARKTFIAAYNGQQNDNDWYYSPGFAGNYETRQEHKLTEYARLRGIGWLPKSEKDERLMIAGENGSGKTQIEYNQSLVTKLRLITQDLVSKQKMIEEKVDADQ